MGECQAAEYYNAACKEVSAMDVYESPYLPLYQAAADMIGPNDRVIDLGSGTGRFARILFDRNHPLVHYLGLDFSDVNLGIARRYNPGFAFVKWDLNDFQKLPLIEPLDVFVVLEVLEHLDDDLKLLKAIPKDKDVILSVPDYDGPAHVRFFENEAAVRNRYDALIHFFEITAIPIKSSRIFLGNGFRKG